MANAKLKKQFKVGDKLWKKGDVVKIGDDPREHEIEGFWINKEPDHSIVQAELITYLNNERTISAGMAAPIDKLTWLRRSPQALSWPAAEPSASPKQISKIKPWEHMARCNQEEPAIEYTFVPNDWKPGDIVTRFGIEYEVVDAFEKSAHIKRTLDDGQISFGQYIPRSELVWQRRQEVEKKPGEMLPIEYGTNRTNLDPLWYSDFPTNLIASEYAVGSLVLATGKHPLNNGKPLLVYSISLRDNGTFRYVVASHGDSRFAYKDDLVKFIPKYKAGDKVEYDRKRWKVAEYHQNGKLHLVNKFARNSSVWESEVTAGWSPTRVENGLWLAHYIGVDPFDRKQGPFPFTMPKAEEQAKALEQFAQKIRDGRIQTQGMEQLFKIQHDEFASIRLSIDYVERKFIEVPIGPEQDFELSSEDDDKSDHRV